MALALSSLGATPTPLFAAGVTALTVLVVVRLGWLIAALALAVWLGGGLGTIVIAAALSSALALRRAGTTWSAPALAPLLGLVGLAGAWPALAGQARRPFQRGALGAVGLWWLLLAEALSGRRLALGVAPEVDARARWEGSVWAAVEHALVPLVTSGVLALAAVWAVAAIVLPALVRGRSLAADVVGASAWAAGLASATQGLSGTLAWSAGPPQMRGLVAGSIVAGVIAVIARASPGEALARSGS